MKKKKKNMKKIKKIHNNVMASVFNKDKEVK